MRMSSATCRFLLAVTVFLLLAHPGWAQSSVSVGNNSMEVSNPLGQVFDIGSFVPTSYITLGESGGADVDFRIKDPNFSLSEDSLFFNSSSANLTLGSGSGTETGDDGDLILLDGTGTQTIRLSGDSGGAATQPATGNGFVKAWVRVMGIDGATMLSRYNVSSVVRESEGLYFVTFSSEVLNDRPIMAQLDGHAAGPSSGGISVGFPDDFHPGTKQIFTYDMDGNLADRSFTLVVY